MIGILTTFIAVALAQTQGYGQETNTNQGQNQDMSQQGTYQAQPNQQQSTTQSTGQGQFGQGQMGQGQMGQGQMGQGQFGQGQGMGQMGQFGQGMGQYSPCNHACIQQPTSAGCAGFQIPAACSQNQMPMQNQMMQGQFGQGPMYQLPAACNHQCLQQPTAQGCQNFQVPAACSMTMQVPRVVPLMVPRPPLIVPRVVNQNVPLEQVPVSSCSSGCAGKELAGQTTGCTAGCL